MIGNKHGWSEYWQTSAGDGEVFVTGEGKKHPALGSFWRQVFATQTPGTRIVDLASGAGSIFSHLAGSNAFELHAVDTAAPALKQLRERVPTTRTVVASAAAVPYTDRSFDLVVSQFGVEYAGLPAFSEAARLVAAGGRLTMLCHISDGYIDARNKACLKAARRLLDNDFINKAAALTEAAFTTDKARYQRAVQAFIPAEQSISRDVREISTGVHVHLYLGFRRLFENRQQYDPDDIVGWLEQMRGDVDRDIFRLSSMRNAALSHADMSVVMASLGEQGLNDIVYEKFFARSDDKPVAWKLNAVRL